MNGGNYIANEIGTTIQQQNGDNRAIRARTLKADTAAIGISNAITFGVKIWIVVSAISQELTVGSIYQMLSAFDSMQTLLQSLVYQISSGYEQSLYVSNLLVLWGLSEESTKMQVELTAPIQKIEFCDVSFSYPGSARPALKNVNLTLTTGSLYTIIGENGSGKSTLIKLMLGLYTPTQGEIMVNEKPISTWSPSSLRKQMSAVFQNQIHYPFDVKTNIGVVEPFRMTNRNDVHSAAERAQADSFIQQLPHGYETQLCKEWKDGFELSGGQWQRIALARFLFPDASLCILDEPFSALDTVAEEHILKEILANQSNKITVLITHRYDDLTDQENIIVMEDGAVSAFGSFRELSTTSNVFAHLLRHIE
jgi:ATP-binding protein of ABC transporter